MTDLPTTERLARDLEAAGAPASMILAAREGYYDDYKSTLAFPLMQLRADATEHHLTAIAQGVVDGAYDATKAESDAWAASPEGQEAFAQLVQPRPNRQQRRHP